MDCFKDQEELYNKSNEHFKDKAREECLLERFANRCKPKCAKLGSNPIGITEKLAQPKSGQAPKEMTVRRYCIQDQFNFLKTHIRSKGLNRSSAFKFLVREASTFTASTHQGFNRLVWRSACDQTKQYSLQLQAQIQFPSIQR